MKITHTAKNIGAAVLGCAMMAGTVCMGGETASSSLANAQEAAIPSTDTDWAFSLSAGWSSKYVTVGLDCLPGSGIWEVAPSISWKDLTLSAWYAGGIPPIMTSWTWFWVTPGSWGSGPSIPGMSTSSISRRTTT